MCSQAANFSFRIGSVMILGRLLEPKDFGLVGMVTAVVGVLSLFRDFGLSTATIQRATITEKQMSTLFWVNISVGAALSAIVVASAPLIARFYHEPRLVAVATVLAASFLFNAAGVQHDALLQRQMRFTTTSIIDILALIVSTGVGVGMAYMGYGYWALVATTVVSPLVASASYWISTKWIPGLPSRGIGIRSILRFGGTLTLNSLVVYVAYNLEKVLLGRFWGANAIGTYGRAYQLVNIPTENLNSAVGGVVFSALSRLQDDPIRFRTYFLKGYSLVLALTLPITILCALFAEDMVFVLLGPKWKEAAPIFRLLAPTIIVFAMINPLAWLLFALGRVERSLHVALVLAPLVIAGYVIGLPYGPKGVAFGYSTVMILWVLPHIAWCVHGTQISMRDILNVFGRPMLSGLVAASLAEGVQLLFVPALAPVARLALGASVLAATYLGMLLIVMGQKAFYLDLFQKLLGRSPTEDKSLVSV